MKGNLPFLLCFTSLRAISKYKLREGLIFGGAIERRVFGVTSLEGLYMEGFIFGILRYYVLIQVYNLTGGSGITQRFVAVDLLIVLAPQSLMTLSYIWKMC